MIAVIVVLIVGTVGYSAYKDYTAVRAELAGGSNQAAAREILNGNTVTVSINITVPNNGLYTLNVTVTCANVNPNVVCASGHVSVPAGQQQVLRFKMTILNIQQYAASSNRRIDGTVSIALVPFASLAIGVDLSGYVKTGGA